MDGDICVCFCEYVLCVCVCFYMWYVRRTCSTVGFASRSVLMKHPISPAIIPRSHSPQTPLNRDPSFQIDEPTTVSRTPSVSFDCRIWCKIQPLVLGIFWKYELTAENNFYHVYKSSAIIVRCSKQRINLCALLVKSRNNFSMRSNQVTVQSFQIQHILFQPPYFISCMKVTRCSNFNYSMIMLH